MAKYEMGDIRNIALVGHGQTGKTTLAEAMLFKAGATTRLGKVEEGSSALDFDPEEKERKISIDSALAHLSWQGREVNLIDCPGYPDFVGHAAAALSVVDTAVVTISAPAGIEVNTRKVWMLADEEGMGKIIVLTKMDADNIDFPALLSSMKEVFGQRCIPLTLPNGMGPNIKGVVNTLNPPADVPAAMKEEVQEAHQALMEAIVEVDDALMEKYLGDEAISPAELGAAFRKAVATGKVTPIVCCAAKKEIGLEEVMNAVVNYAASPAEGPQRKVTVGDNREATPLDPKAEGPFVARVFKSITDPFVGKLAFFRVFSGSINGESSIYNSRSERSEKITQFFRLMGKEQAGTTRLVPGDIVAVSKVEDIMISDTLGDARSRVRFAPIKFPVPMVALAVEPKSRGDEQKISGALAKLADGDPTFRVSRDRQTAELVITGMSQLHLDIMIARLKRRFEVEVTTKQPKIPYKETITGRAEGHHKHKKQTGGRGQYGEVYLRVAPLERGKGFEFVDSIVSATIPGQYVPAVEKGVRETMEKGVLAGYPVEDVQVDVYDGSHHPVDSSEASFKIAASKAFKQAFLAAKAVLLEPIVTLEITVPSRFMGDISGDLNSRRGRILDVQGVGDLQIIRAMIPMAEVMKYATQLRSMTGGQGSYTMEFSHYDIVPARTAETIIAQAKVAEEEEE
jgi:elongation factor G